MTTLAIKNYRDIDFEIVANELRNNYNAIYNGCIKCSETANILTRSKSKWAEYSVRDLCLDPINFDFIETTSNKSLGKHGVLFSEILKLIYAIELYIPYDSRLKIYTYSDSVVIQIVHHFTLRFNNPYNNIYNEDFELTHKVFKDSTIEKTTKVLSGIKFNDFFRADITLN